MPQEADILESPAGENHPQHGLNYWRVEGSLLNLSAVRPLIFFTRNTQSFAERWARRWGLAILALLRPLLYATHRAFATRVLHTLLRGVSRDRLDFLGEEYFHYVLKPRLKRRGVQKLKEALAENGSVVLVSQGLDHVMRPLAEFLGVKHLVANRLEFRDGIATGRLRFPVIRPRGALARLTGRQADGRISRETLSKNLGFSNGLEILDAAVVPSRRPWKPRKSSLVLFDHHKQIPKFSVKETLAGKHILLFGVTGFMGKVWLAMALKNLPEIGKIYLLIRRHRSTTAIRRFERIIEQSPLFASFHQQYGNDLPWFMQDRIEVLEGNVIQPNLGLDSHVAERLRSKTDLIINSSGLTDFTPELGAALISNVDATINILQFLRQCDHAGLLHLSTCYAVGSRDGRVEERLAENYTPINDQSFDVEEQHRRLHALVKQIKTESTSPGVTQTLRRQALEKAKRNNKVLAEVTLDKQIHKNRIRWVRERLVEVGVREAKAFGWPNTYTFTKSLAESMIAKLGADLPVAVVRPSIVESSIRDPFPGWNEGVNTSAPISYVMGTHFRQVPTNERKCLDLLPVDLACRGMTLIAAAIVQGRHERLYQLATSAVNPCDMGRSIELTSLAHRKHYRAQEGLENWLRARLESIPVSMARYEQLSAPRQRAVLRSIQRIGSARRLTRFLVKKERGLDRLEKIIELYKPFILHNVQVFLSDNIKLLSSSLPSEEQAAFCYDPEIIDWWEYWINIHIPALRKWSYPLLEGRPREAQTRRPFKLPVSPPESNRALLGGKTPRSESTWPSS